jgi:2-methylisocitrate lyase-like PEP mutase family enzyme
MAWPELANAEELGDLGVRRLSAGSGISQAAMAAAEKLTNDFLTNGSSVSVYSSVIPYAQLQDMFG